MIYVYTLADPRTNQIRYVGKTNNLSNRYNCHLSVISKNHTSNWIQGLKKQGLKPVMEILDIVDIHNWALMEQYWIAQIRAWGFKLTNLTLGGEGSYGHTQYQVTEKHRLIRSRTHKGKILSKETKEKLALANIGKQLSQETKDKIGKSHINRFQPSMVLHVFHKEGTYSFTTYQAKEVAKRLNCVTSSVLNHITGRSKSTNNHIIHRINCIN